MVDEQGVSRLLELSKKATRVGAFSMASSLTREAATIVEARNDPADVYLLAMLRQCAAGYAELERKRAEVDALRLEYERLTGAPAADNKRKPN